MCDVTKSETGSRFETLWAPCWVIDMTSQLRRQFRILQFSKPMQNHMLLTTIRTTLKPEVEFQHSDCVFSKLEVFVSWLCKTSSPRGPQI